MPEPSAVQTAKTSLVDVDDSVLIVIDIQDHFLAKYDKAKSVSVVEKVCWLLEVAKTLDVPVVAMAEDIANTGPLTNRIEVALPAGTKVHNKDFFGLAGNPDILKAVQATERKTAVLVGMETDVCVSQSALGLISEGYKVVVLKDAVASMDADEEIGLARMREAGAAISSIKAIYYEWIRSVSKAVALHNKAPDIEGSKLPATLVL